jgi:hypothetical protein
MRVEEE